MVLKPFLPMSASLWAALTGRSSVAAQDATRPYVQLAELEIDPAQLEPYTSALREHIETAVRVEPGVIALFAVSEKESPSRIRVFELYASADAYRAHLEAPHFKLYKATTENMVRSLKLVPTDAVVLGAKPHA
jgi:quinol monooxygenase YgiN